MSSARRATTAGQLRCGDRVVRWKVSTGDSEVVEVSRCERRDDRIEVIFVGGWSIVAPLREQLVIEESAHA